MKLFVILAWILIISSGCEEPKTGVDGRILFADGSPPYGRINLTLAICNMDVPIPYCTIDSDNVWQQPTDGKFSFETEEGHYGIAAYVPWIPHVILLNCPQTQLPLIFEVEKDKWTYLGDIEYSDYWCELDPGVDC